MNITATFPQNKRVQWGWDRWRLSQDSWPQELELNMHLLEPNVRELNADGVQSLRNGPPA